MLFALKEVTLGVRDSVTRIAFRYGKACLTECPQAVLEVVIEPQVHGLARGYSGDCLPPLWFDKSPEKSYEQQLDEMMLAIALAAECYGRVFRTRRSFFSGWLDSYQMTMEESRRRGLPELLGSFGSSLVERAILDAICRYCGLALYDALRLNVFGLEPGVVHPELRGAEPSAWLPPLPSRRIWVRQTVGLGDPLTLQDTATGDWPCDGFPVCLEEYIRDARVRYFKVKLAHQLDLDIERLRKLAELVERYCGTDYRLTLDGNELYEHPDDFALLVDRIVHDAALSQLWNNTIAIEQPLPRRIALHPQFSPLLRKLSATKPVIIDESDSHNLSFRHATDCGYRGVSIKNCKGAIKSVLNAGLIAWHNRQHPHEPWLLTGEDLCSVGVVAVQSDLCLAAALGLEHVERNGHHYHRGISYLPREEQEEALFWHRDFYALRAERIAPQIVDGMFHIESFQCVGFGFAVLPRMSQRRCTRFDVGAA